MQTHKHTTVFLTCACAPRHNYNQPHAVTLVPSSKHIVRSTAVHKVIILSKPGPASKSYYLQQQTKINVRKHKTWLSDGTIKLNAGHFSSLEDLKELKTLISINLLSKEKSRGWNISNMWKTSLTIYHSTRSDHLL